MNDGDACFEGDVKANSFTSGPIACDYAEMFETADGLPFDVGYFVPFNSDSDKIRKAHESDDYILGITSSNPVVLADTEEPSCSKYLLDEWNRPIYEKVTIPAIKDTGGNIIVKERIEMRKN